MLMTKLLRYLLILVLCAGALVALFSFGSGPLVDGLLRPWLVARMATELDAEVSLEELEARWGYLGLTGLIVNQPETFELRLAEVTLQFNWTDLLARKVTSLRLKQPELLIRTGGRAPQPARSGAVLPRQPPVTIENWIIENGWLRLDLPPGRLRALRINGSGRIGPDLAGRIRVRPDSDPDQSLVLVATGVWQDGLALTLEQISWNDQPLLTQPVTVRASGSERLTGEFSLEQLDHGELAALFGAMGEPLPWPGDMTWRIRQPGLQFQLARGEVRLQLHTGAGFLHTGNQRFVWQSIQLQADNPGSGVWNLAGTLQLPAQAQVTVAGDWRDSGFQGDGRLSIPRPLEWLRVFDPELPEALELLGELQVAARLEASPGRVAVGPGQISARLATNGTLAAEILGLWDRNEVSLEFSPVEVTVKGHNEPLLTGTCQISGRPGAADWQSGYQLRTRDFVQLVRVAGLSYPEQLPVLSTVQLEGQWQWRNQRLNVPVAVSTLVASPGLQAQVSASLQGRWTAATGFSDSQGSVSVSGLEYTHPDGTVVLAGGFLNLAGTIDQQEDGFSFTLQAETGANEALVDRWYAELRDLPLQLAVPGHWQPSTGQWRFDAAELDLAGLITARFSGTLSPEQFLLDARIEAPVLGGKLQKTAQRLGSGLVPGIESLSLGGGLSVAAQAQGRSEEWQLDLTLQPETMNVSWGDAFHLDGLNGNLPFRVGRGVELNRNPPSRVGRLEWELLRGPLFTGRAGYLAIRAEHNRWSLAEPVEFDLAGGRVRLAGLVLSVADFEPQLRASVSLQDLALSRISQALDGPDLTGRLSAELEEIHLNRTLVQTGDQASLRVFGGDFQVRNMRIEEPWSRFPTYHADVDFSGIDLYELTQTFAFGEINGIADGYVHGLRLFSGVPAAFDARFETRDQGKRNISVKAIRNLNTLSQGGLSAALSQGIYQFIDFYRYRKIGGRFSLANDVFHLTGTARQESDQYLVDGGWLPPKIDVIASSSTISFREMVGRLKRIERTGR